MLKGNAACFCPIFRRAVLRMSGKLLNLKDCLNAMGIAAPARGMQKKYAVEVLLPGRSLSVCPSMLPEQKFTEEGVQVAVKDGFHITAFHARPVVFD